MIKYVFIALVLFVVYHYIYENIILPTIRLSLRYRLFRLRDGLRSLKTKHNNEISEELFEFLQGTINASIKMLPNFNLQMFITAKKLIKNNLELQEHIRKRQKLVEECSVKEIYNVSNESAWILAYSFAANSGGWFVYLLPILITIFFYSTTKNIIRSLAFFPEKEFNEILPASGVAII